MTANRKFVFVSILFLIIVISLFISQCVYALNQEEYQLRCSISFSPSNPHQTQTIIVSFSVENMGNKPFNGKATLDVSTEKHTYSPIIFPINNLVKGYIQNSSQSFRADDEGIWWATLTIEENNLSNINLYVGSQLKEQGARVKDTNTVFVMSLSDFNAEQSNLLATIAIVAGVAVALFSAIKIKNRRRR